VDALEKMLDERFATIGNGMTSRFQVANTRMDTSKKAIPLVEELIPSRP
jgi:hypothetical protein